MSELITINKLELASELANMKLEREWRDTEFKIYEDENTDIITYTEGAQDLFNEYYDEYLSLIESHIVNEDSELLKRVYNGVHNTNY
jgi:hemerythrin-like domain-containing protein